MDDLVLTKENGVAKLTLNRPKKRNAITLQMQSSIGQYFSDIQNDDSIKALVIASEGPVFCSGVDLGDVVSEKVLSIPEALKMAARCEEFFSFRRVFTKPIIVSVKGPCLGFGLLLCLIANIVVAREDATFGLPEIGHGIPPLGVFPYLVAAIGVHKAMELAMLGERIDAGKASNWGIVDRVVAEQEFDEAVTRLSLELAAKDAVAMGLMQYAANQMTEQVIGFSKDYAKGLFALNAQARTIR